MLLGSVARSEESRRLDDDVDAEVRPRQRGRITLGQHLERSPVDADPVALLLDTFEPAVRRVVTKQVRENVWRREIVDRDDVEVAAAIEVRAHEVAPDPPEPVDANLECHGREPL